MPEEPAEKPKLIIDDDWKERVQSEKEAAAAKQPSSGEATPTGTDDADSSQLDSGQPHAGTPDRDAGTQGSDATHELPPASFATLVHSLTAQALASLGQIPDADGKTNVDVGLGKHFIDTLAVLETKTKGNLDEDEAAALAKMLYELRMLFVHVRKEQAAKTGGGDAATDS